MAASYFLNNYKPQIIFRLMYLETYDRHGFKLIELNIGANDFDRLCRGLSVGSRNMIAGTNGRVYLEFNPHIINAIGAEVQAVQVTGEHIDVLLPRGYSADQIRNLNGRTFEVRKATGSKLEARLMFNIDENDTSVRF